MQKFPRFFRILFLLLVGSVLYFLANVQRVAIPGAVFNQLQAKLGVSAPSITALGATFMYVYAVCQLLCGVLIARWGGIRIILSGSVLFCGGTILFSCTNNLTLLYIARGLTGLGASAFYLSLVHEILRTFRQNKSLAVSVVIVIGYAGAVVANAPFTVTVNRFGLSTILQCSAGLAVLVSLIFAAISREYAFPPVSKFSFEMKPFFSALKSAHNRSIFIFSGLNWGIYYVVQTVIGKKFLEDFGGCSETAAAWILSGMGVLSALFGFLFALLSKLTGNRRQIFCRTAGMVCLATIFLECLFVLLNFRSVLLAVPFCILSTTASISAILVPLLKETNEPPLVPYSIALMNFFFYLSVAVLGNLTGLVMDLFPATLRNGLLIYNRWGYLAVFLVLLFCAMPVFLFSRNVIETNGRFHQM